MLLLMAVAHPLALPNYRLAPRPHPPAHTPQVGKYRLEGGKVSSAPHNYATLLLTQPTGSSTQQTLWTTEANFTVDLNLPTCPVSRNESSCPPAR